MKELKVRLMERMLGAELTDHLGYEPAAEPSNQQNSRTRERAGTPPSCIKIVDHCTYTFLNSKSPLPCLAYENIAANRPRFPRLFFRFF
jgi:hypothetical protein